MKSRIIVLIPARFESVRFPGKALADIMGKPMIIHVLENALKAFEDVFVATDDERIEKIVKSAGGQAILTGTHHQSGTERCAEAISLCGIELDSDTIIINLQGDEPLLPSSVIKELAELFKQPDVQIASLVHPIVNPDYISNPNRVKVVLDNYHKALYFSRSPIPYSVNKPSESRSTIMYQHLGIYGYRLRALQEIVKLEPGQLEMSESLEQLRWLENGFTIHCGITDYHGFGIDTPEDLERLKLTL
ncbi:MAG: 3-deoxy-manno-octulosonate cytidylyltransferase [Bacteroidetes bacterium]|jgi:3-deoxy-manno-octulosonate cytidylyltransferase (CMP-KDO synthetase)|nr:3-deoxy-manno-octulosonate cytidylyltransferase [Bacteroidota bacterium]MBT3748766.1 3-deoxy-manno-octulosonate cytidylyltransferase [Bacteroidota bacterium]MBT4398734.1 3-deoxy-manno-octulosonate cytidylyltransferase [Bacteroidota bacterium]MBT4411681.1 3-deoxy-manno-octulosonate cytidylyltransferase [Bacteroidota bacterium]MBT5424860.1 3-deoxy-manno-octulosonate cytidylyltransferase [Bacteroidota bacterium]